MKVLKTSISCLASRPERILLQGGFHIKYKLFSHHNQNRQIELHYKLCIHHWLTICVV